MKQHGMSSENELKNQLESVKSQLTTLQSQYNQATARIVSDLQHYNITTLRHTLFYIQYIQQNKLIIFKRFGL